MVKMNFGGIEEDVITLEEFSLKKAKKNLEDKVIVVIGYGSQGRAQALNLRDNGLDVVVGQREGTKSWGQAISDGFEPLSIEDACSRGDIILYLLSDAGQMKQWSSVKKHLARGKTLCFAHGFSIVYRDQTEVIPPEDIDVILVVPKGSGATVREKGGLNASIAVHQNFTGKAEDTANAIAITIGCQNVFKTTFERETYCNLTAERGVLVGALSGLIEAQYNELRKRGHPPSEAFSETVEQLTESLIPLIGEKGMDYLFANISKTAQRGALNWRHKFKEACEPVFEELYDRVKSGDETEVVLEDIDPADELEEISNSEIWRAGEVIRNLRSKNQ
ncbi:MAG: ketol-acid reductoisomerase [Patescibacteria group bacterium]|nr:ketol-acid reductoisomerase [Patescibacteria group bacterium]